MLQHKDQQSEQPEPTITSTSTSDNRANPNASSGQVPSTPFISTVSFHTSRATIEQFYSFDSESPLPTTSEAARRQEQEPTALEIPRDDRHASLNIVYMSPPPTAETWLASTPSSMMNINFTHSDFDTPERSTVNTLTQDLSTFVYPATLIINPVIVDKTNAPKSDSDDNGNVSDVSAASAVSAREYDDQTSEGTDRVKKLRKHRPPPREKRSSSELDKAPKVVLIESRPSDPNRALWSSSTSTSLESQAFVSPTTASRLALKASQTSHTSGPPVERNRNIGLVLTDPQISDEESRQRFLQAKLELRAQMPHQLEGGGKAVQLTLPTDHTSSSEDSKEAHASKQNDKDKRKKDGLLTKKSSESIPSDEEQRTFSTNLSLGNAFLYMIVPPDGGYGWFIVLISFLCQVIVDGIIFAVGILLPYMGRDLDVSSTRIILVASIQVGPIATALINKYGFRPVALGGAISSCISISVATLSSNMSMLILFYSILGGPSLSLIWVSSQLIIGYYFERYRPIANGVSCSGAGAGILIFSYMNSQIIPKIGWRNTSRVHVGFLLTVILMAITYIEVTPTKVARIKEKNTDSLSSSSSEDENVFGVINSIRYSRAFSVSAKSVDRGIEQMLEEYTEERKPSRVEKCVKSLCPCLRHKESSTEMPDLKEAKHYVIQNDPVERQDLYYTGAAEYAEDATVEAKTVGGQTLEVLPHQRVKSVKYTLSVMHSARKSGRTMTLREMRRRHKHAVWHYISPANWMPRKFVNAFNLLFDFKLLRVMEFQVLVLSAFFFPMGFNIPFVYSKMRAEIDEMNRSLISPTIGFTNFIFRIISGFAANKYKEQTTYICGGGMAFGGVAVLASAFYGEDVVWFQYVYAACYGVAPAFFSTLRAIIYVRALGLEKLTNAFGLTGLAMGLGVFIGTTAAALLNSWTGSYSAAFGFSGVCLLIAGGLKLVLPSLIEQQKRRRSKQRIFM